MNDMLPASLDKLIGTYSSSPAWLAYAAYAAPEPPRPKPIHPMWIFPITADSLSLTWNDYAVHRA